jgi:hypothetical protein
VFGSQVDPLLPLELVLPLLDPVLDVPAEQLVTLLPELHFASGARQAVTAVSPVGHTHFPREQCALELE